MSNGVTCTSLQLSEEALLLCGERSAETLHAVVADQIGKLASDSAQAAVTTKELIEKTIQEIDKGNKVTVATARAFDSIIEGMQEIAGVAKSTTETAQTQAKALRQVEDGIQQISMVTQQNAAASEESSAHTPKYLYPSYAYGQ